jgi:putative aldouronate transport system substrate-binding protein
VNGLYEENLIAPDTFTVDLTMLKALISRVEPAERIVGTATGMYQGNFVDSSIMPYDTFVPVPPLEGPTGLRQTDANTMPITEMRGCITTQCENPEVAMRWLDYWMSQKKGEGWHANSFGLNEGTDYAIVDEENFLGEKPAIRRLRDRATDNYTYGGAILPNVDTLERYSLAKDPGAVTTLLVDSSALYKPYAIPNNIPPISWGDEEMVQSVSEYQTMFKDYILSSATKFIVGEMDLDRDWDSYSNELEAMGLPDYLALLADYYGK